MCCSMPSATPGRRQALVLSTAPVPVVCVYDQIFDLPNEYISGLTTGFSDPRFTSQPFKTPELPRALGVEFPSPPFRLWRGFLVTP